MARRRPIKKPKEGKEKKFNRFLHSNLKEDDENLLPSLLNDGGMRLSFESNAFDINNAECSNVSGQEDSKKQQGSRHYHNRSPRNLRRKVLPPT